jgi:hypothetical protein
MHTSLLTATKHEPTQQPAVSAALSHDHSVSTTVADRCCFWPSRLCALAQQHNPSPGKKIRVETSHEQRLIKLVNYCSTSENTLWHKCAGAKQFCIVLCPP